MSLEWTTRRHTLKALSLAVLLLTLLAVSPLVATPVLAQQAPGTWSNVTPSSPLPTFCCQSVVADPLTPSTLYWQGGDHLYKSTDYGVSWSQVDNGSFIADRSTALAIAPT